MATKRFSLNTVPHVVEIGDDIRLELLPEINGTEFLDRFEELQEAYKKVEGGAEEVDVAQLRATMDAIHAFLRSLMLPESAAQFAEMSFPNHVMMGIFEFAMELYGGGSEGARPSTSSRGSVSRSPRTGTRSRAN
ncbi:hypothetical protein [Streptomyces sp. AD55]|uniref:hypothetical protein n=1 Tax=Streptomyces sp. AD55 TaxID=3242895 RepID=UPI0035295168